MSSSPINYGLPGDCQSRGYNPPHATILAVRDPVHISASLQLVYQRPDRSSPQLQYLGQLSLRRVRKPKNIQNRSPLSPREFQRCHIRIESLPKPACNTVYQKRQLNSLIVQEIIVNKTLIFLLGHSN
mgnify:CR=1 FL=1